ncbi:MAG: DUF72 domain-containing protein [Candidatus Dormibacteraceae bacterium]
MELAAINPHDPGTVAAAAIAAATPAGAASPFRVEGGNEIRVGTASWTDPTMTAAGVFYPEGAANAADRLRFYADNFPVVEVDSTYYAIPPPATARLWVDRTPPGFVFDVKAHALFTGQPAEVKRLPRPIRDELPAALAAKSRIYGKDLPAELRDATWELFLTALAPLREAGKLGAVFLQFPRWVFPSDEAREQILEAQKRLAGMDLTVEFRHGSWFNEKNAERTLRFLTDAAIPYVMVDGPQGFKSSIPPLAAVTAPGLAVVRFHGRRTETWERPGVETVERFRYLYDEDELADWVPRIREVAKQAARTHVLMNNCYGNYGTTNARQIADLLQNG